MAHLEADLALLACRKAELERENESLAAIAAQNGTAQASFEAQLAEAQRGREGLEAALAEARGTREALEAQLADALGSRETLEAECRRMREELARNEDLEKQQAAVASSFAELQGVVAQLVRRLTELDGKRSRLAEEKGAAEAVAATLRIELQKWRGSAGATPERSREARQARSNAGGRSNGAHRAGDLYRAESGCRQRRGGCSGGRGASRRTPSESQRPWGASQTPPRRGKWAAPGAAARGAQGGHTDATRGTAAPQMPVPSPDDLRYSQSQMECALLRQQLLSEEQAFAAARQSREAIIDESTCAESKTAVLQGELRDMLATWSVRGGSDTEASLTPRLPVQPGLQIGQQQG